MTVSEIAEKEVGYKEEPPNSNLTKFGEWFGFNGVAWCGIFVSWCYFMAGMPLPAIGFPKGFAGCQTAVKYFRDNDKITAEPQNGDVVFFDWNGDGRYDHTGIFVAWIDENTFYSIEGNTSLLNQSNGGEVMIRERNKSHAIFVHP